MVKYKLLRVFDTDFGWVDLQDNLRWNLGCTMVGIPKPLVSRINSVPMHFYEYIIYTKK